MNKIIKLISVSVVTVLMTASAFGLGLDEARKGGLVEEQPSGYIKAVSPKAKALVKETNAKRKKAFQQLAKKNKITVEQVGERAAKMIKTKLGK